MKTWPVLLLCWLSVAGLSWHLRAEHAKLQPVKPTVRYQDIFLDLLGEGRTLLARFLWFKVDLIHEQQEEKGVGVFQEKELIPLLRMITYLDPYLVDAYDLIAYDLYKGYKQADLAIELVDEGLKYSPNSYALNFRRAFLALQQKDMINALEFAKKAYASPDPDANRVLALKIMYHCAVQRRDARLGIVVVEHLVANGARVPDPAQLARWQAEVKASP
jgi:tetratricopeptide (TPR) repeat protein